MNRRAFLCGFTLGIMAAPLAAEAQEAGKTWRIGFLSPYSADFDKTWRAALWHGLRDLGYVEGKSIIIEQRHADGTIERLPQLAQELVRLKIDIFVAHGHPAVSAARKASSTAPIVMCPAADPVGVGLVASLARPGGNITGVSDLHSGLVTKRLDLLKEVVPSASRVAVLLDPASPTQVDQFKSLQAAAPALRLTLLPVEIKGPDDIDPGFAAIRRERVEAVNILGGAATIHLKRVAELAIKSRMATISTTRRAAEDGFLMAYGADFSDLYRRAATYVDKILKGAKPAELPIEQPTKFELVINLKTAKALRLTIPPSVLGRADHVIE